MYGPPPDPREVLARVELIDVPGAYLLCLAVAVGLTSLAWLKRLPVAVRGLAFCLGQTVLLTSPLLAFLNTTWFGRYPTIDKEGSLLFYLQGVHRTLLLHPVAALDDPAAALIGVHTGHLWVIALFDLFLTPNGAFNLAALLSPALAWWAAWLLLRDVSGEGRVAMVIAFAWGMGLHVFRDLNWYTIEKAAIFWLALYLWALHRAWRDGGRWPWVAGVLYALMCWMNLYLGMVGAALGGLALAATAWTAWRRPSDEAAAGLRRVLYANLACLGLVSPLVAQQAALMAHGPALATPEQFLHERAALDSFTLSPPRWNRLEIWRALNLVPLGLAALGLWRSWADGRVRFAAFAALALFAISLGPELHAGLGNPVYMSIWHIVPGFWRVAKPEVFFHGTWLLLCAIASVELVRESPRARGIWTLYAIFVGFWLLMVRSHPAYPPLTMPVDSALRPDWQDQLPDGVE